MNRFGAKVRTLSRLGSNWVECPVKVIIHTKNWFKTPGLGCKKTSISIEKSSGIELAATRLLFFENN
jgi:hypothetical protein